MAKIVKAIVAIAVAVAIPFVAPAIAGAIGASTAVAGVASALGVSGGVAASGVAFGTAATIGTTIASAGVGAVLGAVNAKVTGGDVKTGALLGGLGGGIGGYTTQVAANAANAGNVGLNTSSGVSGTTATSAQLNAAPGATTAALDTAGKTGLAVTGTALDGGVTLANGATVTATGALVQPTITQAVTTGLTSTITQLTNPDTLLRITTLALAADPDITGLSAGEQELVALRKAELQQMATENRALFEAQVANAEALMQAADQQAANPEGAYAETKIRTERQLEEETRGQSADRAAATRRAGLIDSTVTGTIAAASEQERGDAAQMRYRTAANSALPDAAPQGYAGLAMPMYNDLAERRRQAQNDLVYGVGRTLGVGDLTGRKNNELFGSITGNA
jgi:hypothetical protein